MDTRSLAQRMVDAANAINANRAAEERRRAGRQATEPTCLPLPSYWVTDPASAHLPAIQRWSHPFGDRADPLRQLTQLANAERGYYPLGRNGFWHPGVHFDAGTAGTLDQSQVLCLADGEVVAYRTDTQSPRTGYLFDDEPVECPFSRNFVLVRHRLQAPEIPGLDATPPSLTLYSLYMHLEDWTAYREDQTLKRPAFWPESNTRRVKDTEKDAVPDLTGHVWLRCRIGPNGGAVISGLARGTEVTVSGTGRYRKIENIPGPRQLLQDGALLGYVGFSLLEPLPNGDYRIATLRDDGTLPVRPSASVEGKPLMALPNGTEVAISGTGDYRKLEWVNQYVHFDSLLGEREPQILDDICVPEAPVPIRAGELIGHIGAYQDHDDAQPRQQLHLEVFSSESLQTFFEVSRAWAQRLPASARTWLKLPKGTPVVKHQAHFSASVPPKASADTPSSAADLHLPKHLLEGLGPDMRIRVPNRDGQGGCTWYRLDDLLHDSEGQLLPGWVQVEDDHAQWHSPWDWSGYAAILNGDSLESCQAYALNLQGILPSERDRAQAALLADRTDQGPIRSRLFDLIEPDRHGVMTAEELKPALPVPALAQSIARLAIYSESEWYWRPGKWDALDDLFGHSSPSPNRNWLAEKQRIEQICWWNEVAPKLGLPADGKVWHLHPVGLVGSFERKQLITLEMLLAVEPNNKKEYYQEIIDLLNKFAESYQINTPKRISHFLSQISHESNFRSHEENLSYSPKQMRKVYGCRGGFRNYDELCDDCTAGRFREKLWSQAAHYAYNPENLASYVYANRMGNGSEESKDGYRYRGRGLIQLTGKAGYESFQTEHNRIFPNDKIDLINNPELLSQNLEYSIESAFVFWSINNLNKTAESATVSDVTRIVNGGQNGLSDRKNRYNRLARLFNLKEEKYE
ncbi:hypothetical protein [Metapseudomonas boanensis]|uniref:Glycoside hydrolase family 19 protein n=1 Tax=Metapseudomonas boanensis TaxID=2822138 RepID=A0ABS5XDQ6_9GAMM|nr:hypothetical protein [Pseudomonas boanensis]MBT8765823.1 glycoside hydrolase family 19 protein [Pseudomonas boanensis]